MSQAGKFGSGITPPPAGFVETLTGDIGGPVPPSAGNINVITGQSLLNSGSTVLFDGSPGLSTLLLNVTDENNNTLIGMDAGNLSVSGNDNTALGAGTLSALTSGTFNVAIGNQALNALTTATSNTAVGALTLQFLSTTAQGCTAVGFGAGRFVTTAQSLTAFGVGAATNLTSGQNNTAIGAHALGSATTGAGNTGDNTAVGNQALIFLTTGIENCAIGSSVGSTLRTGSYNTLLGANVLLLPTGGNYTGAESSNVLLANAGVGGESNVMRLGTSGAGNGQVNKCFIAGIDGVNLTSANVVTEVSGQLGSATITAGTNISISTATPNQIIISANASSVTENYTGINHASSPYTALSTDYYISADVTAGVITVYLPALPVTGRTLVIKDKVGMSAASNITVTTLAGIVNIDGATTYVMNTAYEAIQVIYNGSSWEVF